MPAFTEAATRCYIPVWRRVLIGWLGWNSARFEAWLLGWKDELTDESSIFYHEDEWYYIVPLLVPDELSDLLAKQHTKRMYNDLAYLWHEELDRAIRGVPHMGCVGTPEFDWDAAKRRASTVLQTHGYDLPDPTHITQYEVSVLNRGRTT